MRNRLFQEGGPFKIRRTGDDQYNLTIPLHPDQKGMIGRECPDSTCSPGSFKVKNGTGITDQDYQIAYCPYCRRSAKPDEFTTQEQIRYAQDIAKAEATKGINRMMAEALGLDSRGRRKLGGGLLSVEISTKPARPAPVRRPWEEQLRRDVTCPHCTLEHAVYGLAVWCSDCGEDIFLTHVEAECQVVQLMLNDVDRRNEELGARVAARDIENGLEDTVSIFEAAMKAMVRRKLADGGQSADAIDTFLKKKVRTQFQGYDSAARVLQEHFDVSLDTALPAESVDQFKHTLEKRHPITHNLGIVDRKYLERVRSGEAEGRDVSLDEREVLRALDSTLSLIRHVHAALFAG